MEEIIATETPTIAPATTTPVLTPTEDNEARYAALEAEKNKAIEEGANYKLAYLKEKNKEHVDEDEEDRMTRIAAKVLADSRLAEIAREQDSIIQRALKENKELKLAQMNKTTTPAAAIGTHTESQPVVDTLVTPDQIAAFKARGWSDKDIERYKGNLRKNTR